MTKGRRRKMKVLQERRQKSEEQQKKLKRRLVPNYEQRLKALKMKGTASFVRPEEKGEDDEAVDRS